MRSVFIDPGRFRFALSLREQVTAPDGAGGFQESWNEIATVMAMIEPLGAEVRYGAGQTLETVSHRIVCRFREDLKSGMRLVVNGRAFDVVSVHDPDETRRYLVCRAREKGL